MGLSFSEHSRSGAITPRLATDVSQAHPRDGIANVPRSARSPTPDAARRGRRASPDVGAARQSAQQRRARRECHVTLCQSPSEHDDIRLS